MTIVDLYELVARERGVRAEDLPASEREDLCMRALRHEEPTFAILPETGRWERDPIELAPYDPSWPAMFEAWKAKLSTALGRTARRIDHIGSTAVPGLMAKPIVDIQVSVDDLEDEASYVPAIEGLGVQLRSRDREHRFFRPFSGRPRDVQIHLCAAGSPWERRHLAFRDHLRSSSAARAAYLAAKREAAARWRDDRIAYAEAKGPIINELTDQALGLEHSTE